MNPPRERDVEGSPACFATRVLEREGRSLCSTYLTFDFIPAVDLDHTRRLVETESLEATAGLRRWTQTTASAVTVGDRSGMLLTAGGPEDRRLQHVYLVPLADGVLVVHRVAVGDEEGPGGCAAEHLRDATDVVTAFGSDEAILRQAEVLSQASQPRPAREVEPLPTDLEGCYAALTRLLTPEDLSTFRDLASEDDVAGYHFGLGLWMRNSWGLWAGSPLARYFNGMGIFHPDDMSGIILTSFWRQLNGKPIRLEEQVSEYQAYWNEVGKEPKRVVYQPPVFPEQARVAKAEGRVRLQAVVTSDGTVGDVKVLHCDRPGFGFEEAAVEAVKKWRYEPATKNGQPIDVFMIVEVGFTFEPDRP